MRPVAAGLLKGVLELSMGENVNFVNAPVVARERGKNPEDIFPAALLAAYRSAELMKTEVGK